jgi:hypothetical protein
MILINEFLIHLLERETPTCYFIFPVEKHLILHVGGLDFDADYEPENLVFMRAIMIYRADLRYVCSYKASPAVPAKPKAGMYRGKNWYSPHIHIR